MKTKPEVMITVAVLAWFLIHDSSDWMSHIWIDLGCMAFMGGCVSMVFLHFFKKNAPYPQKDPRIAETMGVYVQLHSEAKAAGK